VSIKTTEPSDCCQYMHAQQNLANLSCLRK